MAAISKSCLGAAERDRLFRFTTSDGRLVDGRDGGAVRRGWEFGEDAPRVRAAVLGFIAEQTPR